MIPFIKHIKKEMLDEPWTPERSNAVEIIDVLMDKEKETQLESNEAN